MEEKKDDGVEERWLSSGGKPCLGSWISDLTARNN